MNQYRSYTFFKSILTNAFSLIIVLGMVSSCGKQDYSLEINGPSAGGYSILVNNGNVLVSGYYSENGLVGSKYWINGESAEQSRFTSLVGNQFGYRPSIDEKYRRVYTYKNKSGEIQTYRFNQSPGAEGGRMLYYKNDVLMQLENDSIGNLTSVDFYDDKPMFAGSLGKMASGLSGGPSYIPKTAFIWDGHSTMTQLMPPAESTLFWGVSTIYSPSPNETYVGGLCGIPMYWKNKDPVVLDTRFGEIWQITKSGSDVFAVGLVNKFNSNSTAHTACYWKNGVLHELEDNAQAYGIFLDGADVYVTGSIGKVPASYKPCYWKNGVRVELPM